MARPKTRTVTVWETQHKKSYPAAQRKRIYARPKTVTVSIAPKTALQRIMEG